MLDWIQNQEIDLTKADIAFLERQRISAKKHLTHPLSKEFRKSELQKIATRLRKARKELTKLEDSS